MAERQRKAGSKSKGKAPVLSRQKTLFEMFPKTTALPITVSSIQESSDIFENPQDCDAAKDDCIEEIVVVLPRAEVEKAPGPLQGERDTATFPFEYRQPAVPIVIEDTPPPEIHAWGTSIAATSPPSLPAIELQQGSNHLVPIIVDSSPIQPSAPLKSSGFHPFFAPRQSMKRAKKSSNASASKSWAVPYPDRLCQHVKGPQTLFPSPKQLPPNRNRMRHLQAGTHTTPPSYAFLSPCVTQPNASSNEGPLTSQKPQVPLEHGIETIPGDHILQYPSISRMINEIRAGQTLHPPDDRPWADKWRPRCADEVLGNETSARYLRNWLQALALQLEDTSSSTNTTLDRPTKKGSKNTLKRGRKRPRVITEVARGRARKRARTESDDDEEEEDWIVYTDQEDDNECPYTSGTDAEPLPPSSPLPSFPEKTIEADSLSRSDLSLNLDQLHNTILITGLPGTGKTATVYACAEELGWDVFEVYPGIGKRNGSNIENLVGEVGKNHLVRQRPHGGHDFFTIASPSKRQASANPPSNSACGTVDGLLHREDDAALQDGVLQDGSRDLPRSLAQSLILLEEVDVLFKEDGNFWSTVMNVIKECKRPVICTCNDLSLVPVSALPIQTILTLEPCSTDITVSYLQSLACLEGRPVDRKTLKETIKSRGWLVDQSPETGTPTNSVHDLRHAINMLQVFSTTSFSQLTSVSLPSGDEIAFPSSTPGCAPGEPPETEEERLRTLAELEGAFNEADTASFLDSQLYYDTLNRQLVVEIESSGASCDDEIGHTILYDTRRDWSLPSTYNRDTEIQKAVQDHIRGGNGVTASIINNELDEAQSLTTKMGRFRRHFGHVLRDVCPKVVWRLPLPHLYTDYRPLISQIGDADEAQAEALVRKAQERGGRRTRNSALTEYVRTLTLSDLGRVGMSEICFWE